MIKLAKYQCLNCNATWESKPGPITQKDGSGCPACGLLWIKWLNYETDFVRKEK
jgi:DNA-directed RNA polymerase subunit RPC12/RpoP